MNRLLTLSVAVFGLGAALLLGGCERPPVESKQNGYRGTGMVQVSNPRIAATTAALHVAPPGTPPAGSDGPKAKDVYQNVRVLGDLSVAEFTRHMVAITQWVSPADGCNYCHNPQNLADDSKYTKVVARRMIQMTQHLNADWKNHVGNTGVTCYTCHRGQAVPANVWFTPQAPKAAKLFLGDDAGQNRPMSVVGLSSLPYDPFTTYLRDDAVIRVNGKTALPTGNRQSTKQAEHTYGLMVHMSEGLGVNCTFCHNTRSFASWEGPVQRVTAYHGIRMARDLNVAYMEPLTKSFPANRLGPNGDVAKANCATCHQGVNKPLNGAAMAKDYAGLLSATKPTAGLPQPLSEPTRSVLYFGVGSAALDGEQAKGLAQLIATMSAKPEAKVAISGYHSASGELASNQELAKQRAIGVRDALLGAGIAETRVMLDKPLQAEANLSGEDPAARRVEANLK
jgi:photosynthetic reaction center cytochrome c subunit